MSERSGGFGTEPGSCLCLEALKSHSRDAKRDRLSSHTSAVHVLDPFTIPPICMREGPFCSTDSSEKRRTSGRPAANSCSPQLEFICDRDRQDRGQEPPLRHTHAFTTDRHFQHADAGSLISLNNKRVRGEKSPPSADTV